MTSEIRILDRADIGKTRMTADGYMVGEVRCARTGVQTYMAADFGLPGGGVIGVYRPETAVFDKASLATYAGKPVTMGHPPELVTADNWKTYAAGDIGGEIARDGEFVVVPIKLMDAQAIAAVQNGTREISMGYTTTISIEDGTAPDGTPYQAVQTGPIRINHLAIVPRARGGSSLRIGDGANSWGAAPITPERKDTAMADTALASVVLGDKAVQVTVADAPAVEAFKTAASKAMADAAAQHDKAIAAKDAEIAKKDAEIADLQGKIVDGAALDKLVADRAALITKAKAVAKDIVTDGKSAAGIKRAAVVAKRGAAFADRSDSYIDAAFDLLSDMDEEEGDDKAKKALSDAAKDKSKGGKSDAYDNYVANLADAWKGGK